MGALQFDDPHRQPFGERDEGRDDGEVVVVGAHPRVIREVSLI